MKSFYHAGDVGDLVYGLYVMKALGGGELLVGRRTTLAHLQPRAGISPQVYFNIITLLRSQPYVKRTQWVETPPFVDYDLNRFRCHWLGLLPTGLNSHLLEMHCAAFGLTLKDEPWLTVGQRRVAPVIISRSARQRNHHFPWTEVLAKYRGSLGFIGFPDEHANFQRDFGPVPFIETRMFLHAAEVIAGADLFIGNSSAPLALAEALKKPILQETSAETVEKAHTQSLRASAIDWKPGVSLPNL